MNNNDHRGVFSSISTITGILLDRTIALTLAINVWVGTIIFLPTKPDALSATSKHVPPEQVATAYFVPQYLDSGKIVSTGEIKLITISEDDYKKIVNNTTKTNAIAPNTAITKTSIDEFVKIVKKIHQK